MSSKEKYIINPVICRECKTETYHDIVNPHLAFTCPKCGTEHIIGV